MVDKNKNGVDDSLEGGSDIADISQVSSSLTNILPGYTSALTPPIRQVYGYVDSPTIRKEAGAISVSAAKDEAYSGTRQPKMYYSGSGLVDASGLVARMPYQTDDGADASTQLKLMTGDERLRVLMELKRVGYYQGREITELAKGKVGFGDSDLNAFNDFLQQAVNPSGYTWDVVLPSLGNYSTVSGGGGSAYRATSAEDLGAYLSAASFKTLGRKMTKAEIMEAVQNINNKERAQYAAGMNVSAPSVLAEQQAMAASPEEAGSYSAGNAIMRMYQLFGQGRTA